MIPSLDLLLGTLERALEVTILPSAANAAAKEEASLGVLFVRWLRDVVDHCADAERASQADCRAALADVAAIVAAHRPGASSAAVARDASQLLERPAPAELGAVREDARRAKALLSRALRAAREDGDDPMASEIRLRLAELGAREIERERAFGRATGMDPDSQTIPTLAEITRRTR